MMTASCLGRASFLVLVLTFIFVGATAQSFTCVTKEKVYMYESATDQNPIVQSLNDAQSIVAAAAAPGGAAEGFVAIGTSSAVAYVNGTWSSSTFSSSGLHSVAFFDSQRVVVAGVIAGTLYNQPFTVTSEDGGRTWGAASTHDTGDTTGLIAVSTGTSPFGVAILGGYFYTSTDAKQWTYNSVTASQCSALAVLNAQLAVAACGSQLKLSTSPTSSKWSTVTLPFTTAVSGIALVDAQTWVVTNQQGQIWRTETAGTNWSVTATASAGAQWASLTRKAGSGELVAAGSKNNGGIVGVSSDDGKTWSISAQGDAAFVAVVVGEPTIAAVSPSPSPSVSASASPSAHAVAVSVSPSPTASPSRAASPTPSPSAHSPSPTPSASPSQHTASPTPSASPSAHSASPTPSVTPSQSRSPSPSPSKQSATPSASPSPSPPHAKEPNLPLIGLGLGLGAGGLAVVAVCVCLFLYLGRSRVRRAHYYQPINSSV